MAEKQNNINQVFLCQKFNNTYVPISSEFLLNISISEQIGGFSNNDEETKKSENIKKAGDIIDDLLKSIDLKEIEQKREMPYQDKVMPTPIDDKINLSSFSPYVVQQDTSKDNIETLKVNNMLKGILNQN